MLGEVLWVLAVVAFWALVFSLMFLLVGRIARERDGEEVVCALPVAGQDVVPRPA